MPEDKDVSIIKHLEELRSVLIKCLVVFGVILPIMFIFSPKILNILISVITQGTDVTLNFFSPTEVFIIQIKISMLLSLIISFPYIVRQIWGFILPALYENEQKFIKSIVLTSALLFLFGVCFCIFLILPS